MVKNVHTAPLMSHAGYANVTDPEGFIALWGI